MRTSRFAILLAITIVLVAASPSAIAADSNGADRLGQLVEFVTDLLGLFDEADEPSSDSPAQESSGGNEGPEDESGPCVDPWG